MLYPHRRTSRVSAARNIVHPGYEGYLASFEDPGFEGGDVGHLILGGQPDRFSLRGEIGQNWPRPGEDSPDRGSRLIGKLTVIRRAAVHNLPALVVRAAPYPRGGIHDGHVVVLWNEERHGYLVSLHFSGHGAHRYTEDERTEAALRIAASTADLAFPVSSGSGRQRVSGDRSASDRPRSGVSRGRCGSETTASSRSFTTSRRRPSSSASRWCWPI